MSVIGCTHKMALWSYKSKQEWQIQIVVGQVSAPHYALCSTTNYSQDQWNAGQSAHECVWLDTQHGFLVISVPGHKDLGRRLSTVMATLRHTGMLVSPLVYLDGHTSNSFGSARPTMTFTSNEHTHVFVVTH